MDAIAIEVVEGLNRVRALANGAGDGIAQVEREVVLLECRNDRRIFNSHDGCGKTHRAVCGCCTSHSPASERLEVEREVAGHEVHIADSLAEEADVAILGGEVGCRADRLVIHRSPAAAALDELDASRRGAVGVAVEARCAVRPVKLVILEVFLVCARPHRVVGEILVPEIPCVNIVLGERHELDIDAVRIDVTGRERALHHARAPLAKYLRRGDRIGCHQAEDRIGRCGACLGGGLNYDWSIGDIELAIICKLEPERGLWRIGYFRLGENMRDESRDDSRREGIVASLREVAPAVAICIGPGIIHARARVAPGVDALPAIFEEVVVGDYLAHIIVARLDEVVEERRSDALCIVDIEIGTGQLGCAIFRPVRKTIVIIVLEHRILGCDRVLVGICLCHAHTAHEDVFGIPRIHRSAAIVILEDRECAGDGLGRAIRVIPRADCSVSERSGDAVRAEHHI